MVLSKVYPKGYEDTDAIIEIKKYNARKKNPRVYYNKKDKVWLTEEEWKSLSPEEEENYEHVDEGYEEVELTDKL